MNLRDFATLYGLRVKRDGCGDFIVPARLGHLYEHDSRRFGLVLEASATDTRLDNTLRSRKRKAIRGGFQLHQDGDVEGILLFDPSDSRQACLAVRLIEAKRKRKQSPRQLANLRRGPEKGPRQRPEPTIPSEISVGAVE